MKSYIEFQFNLVVYLYAQFNLSQRKDCGIHLTHNDKRTLQRKPFNDKRNIMKNMKQIALGSEDMLETASLMKEVASVSFYFFNSWKFAQNNSPERG